MHSAHDSRCLGYPDLIAGDFQASASGLIDSASLHAANFSILNSTSAAKHSDRNIDHLLVSSWAACLFSIPVVAPQVRSDHLGVNTTVCRAPLSLHAMQCRKPRYIDHPAKTCGPFPWVPDLWSSSWCKVAEGFPSLAFIGPLIFNVFQMQCVSLDHFWTVTSNASENFVIASAGTNPRDAPT